MTVPAPVFCPECGRAISVSATRCLWCGLTIANNQTAVSFEPAQAELDYLGGIERLQDPVPIKLVVSEDGVEITEVMPGSRRILIPRDSLIEAVLVDASAIEKNQGRPTWRTRLGFGLRKPRTQSPLKIHDYRLNIRYRMEAGEHTATFRRQDTHGLIMIHTVVRSVTALVSTRNE